MLARLAATQLVAITLVVATPLSAQPVAAPQIGSVAQAYDDDCGLAALLTLFQLADMAVRPEDLADGLARGSPGQGLTGTDLVDMVAHLDRGITLAAGFVPLDRLDERGAREAFIVLMKPRSFGGAAGFDHFVVLERRLQGGFRVADPVLAASAFLSDAVVERDAHMEILNGRPHVLVFRLVRDGIGLAAATPPRSEDERLRPWELLHRLPRPLPPGKWTVEASVAESVSEVPVFEDVQLGGSTRVYRLAVSRGLTARSQISFEMVTAESSAVLRAGSDAYSIGGAASSSGTLNWTTFPDYNLPLGMTGSYSLEAYWTSVGFPAQVAAAVQADHREGDFAINVASEVRVDFSSGEAAFYLTPTLSYERVLPGSITVGTALTIPTRDLNRPDRAYASAFISKSMSSNTNIVLFYEREILQRHGVEENQLGVTVTFGIPRPFPRSRQ